MLKVKKLSNQKKRVETGPIQFGEDWPGLFIRGDNCIYHSMYLRIVLESIKDSQDKLLISQIENLIELMESPLIKP